MRKRRRKRKYTWLPLQGQTTNVDDGNVTQLTSCFSTSLNLDQDEIRDGGYQVGILPVVRDFPQTTNILEPTAFPEEEGIGEIIGNDYYIKRIVGKVFANYVTSQDPELDIWVPEEFPAIMATVGFFIARADIIAPNIPAAAQEPGAGNALYNPQALSANREPWIWRRSWALGVRDNKPATTVLANPPPDLSVPVFGGDSFAWPRCNADYGSVLDGPHIDAKTSRRVTQEERLYVAFSAINIPIPTQGAALSVDAVRVLRLTFDLRILGALRRPHNRGVF